MKLVFRYPDPFGSLEILLATQAYEAIWKEDGERICERFRHYTGLTFQQDTIEVIIHDGQSMSGMDGKPMRLNLRNGTIIEKRSALVHELAHRLLFGNGLYAPDDAAENDNDETRVLLFQGDVLYDLYGQTDYEHWTNLDPEEHIEEYLSDLRYVLSLSKEERSNKIRHIIAASTNV